MKMQRLNAPVLLALASALAFTVAACGSDNIQDVERAAIVLNPSAVVFSAVNIGQTDTALVDIVNEGDSTLRITGFELNGPQGSFSVDGLDTFPLDIEPQDIYTFTAYYTPQTTNRAEGSIVFEHNGTGNGTVQLTTQELQGRVFVNPNPINFGRVPEGEIAQEQVQIQNIGTSSLTLSNLTVISPSGEFSVPAEALQQTQGLELAAAGEEGDTFTFNLEYAPTTSGYDDGVLVVRSNDPNNPEFRVPIQANGAEPCINVSHEAGYNFGQRLILRTHEEVFTITNCSSAANGETLVVDSLAFTDEVFESSPAFALDALPTFPLELDPQETATFVVAYSPEVEDQTDRALLRVVSNDEIKSPLDIEITGIGSDNQCPNAVATCVVRDSGAPPSTELSVLPLDILDCTAAASSDPDDDGSIVEYIWEVVERPDGSTATFDDPGAVNNSFFVDLAGRYVFRLNLIDDKGAEACTPALVTVVSTPDEDIHVQLVWHTPADADETDTGFGAGSDIDLHLVHPNGCWDDNQWDCHWRETEPNWGDTSRADDDPSLDIDDTDGAGPENINLNNPEDGVIYRVGVHYYNDHGYGTSFATVRLYLFGTVVFEQEKEMPSRDFFWDVAGISWPSGEITVIDATYPDVPTCR
jgi:hypothetical protein